MFASVNLSALVYQHSITPLALPIRLILPVSDITEDSRVHSAVQENNKKMSVKDLLEKGAGKMRHCYCFDSIDLVFIFSLQCSLFK